MLPAAFFATAAASSAATYAYTKWIYPPDYSPDENYESEPTEENSSSDSSNKIEITRALAKRDEKYDQLLKDIREAQNRIRPSTSLPETPSVNYLDDIKSGRYRLRHVEPESRNRKSELLDHIKTGRSALRHVNLPQSNSVPTSSPSPPPNSLDQLYEQILSRRFRLVEDSESEESDSSGFSESEEEPPAEIFELEIHSSDSEIESDSVMSTQSLKKRLDELIQEERKLKEKFWRRADLNLIKRSNYYSSDSSEDESSFSSSSDNSEDDSEDSSSDNSLDSSLDNSEDDSSLDNSEDDSLNLDEPSESLEHLEQDEDEEHSEQTLNLDEYMEENSEGESSDEYMEESSELSEKPVQSSLTPELEQELDRLLQEIYDERPLNDK